MRTDPADAVFKILADPTRRRILDLLADHGPLSVTQLADEFPDLVASGISKHLMGLRSAGLVHATRDGRQKIYALDGTALAGRLGPWLEKYDRFWGAALERLRRLAEDDPGAEGGRKSPKKARQRRWK